MVGVDGLDGFKNLKLLSEFNTNVENIQITKVMNYVGLDPLSETKVCNYSCAMYKKLCLAYALIPNTNILIINEPFKHLNNYALKDFITIYGKLRLNHTIIYISESNDYLNENFTLNMLTPVPYKEKVYKAFVHQPSKRQILYRFQIERSSVVQHERTKAVYGKLLRL